jgi:hypothetical protein
LLLLRKEFAKSLSLNTLNRRDVTGRLTQAARLRGDLPKKSLAYFRALISRREIEMIGPVEETGTPAHGVSTTSPITPRLGP